MEGIIGNIGFYIVLFALGFIQNMSFTVTSRARNSGDANYFRGAAYVTNSMWFVNQIFLAKALIQPAMEGNYLEVAVSGVVFVVSNTEGAVFMMNVLLGSSRSKLLKKYFQESGKRKVGAN